MTDPEIEARLIRLAGARGFHAESVALELRGHCAACGDRHHGHAHA
jgi:Fe2+ or Zn2+ uptake regulation protein